MKLIEQIIEADRRVTVWTEKRFPRIGRQAQWVRDHIVLVVVLLAIGLLIDALLWWS